MTGQRRNPEELRKKLSQLIRYEMESLPTSAIGRIKNLDEANRRAEIETVPDGATETNVPIASTFAGDGMGDLRPLDPAERDQPVYGIVLYTHHDLDDQLASHGNAFDGQREHEEENCVFLPAQIWFDDDEVPAHTGSERRIDHPDGGTIEITDSTLEAFGALEGGLEVAETVDRYEPVEDDDGNMITRAEYLAEMLGEEDAPTPDNTEWPIDEDAAVDQHASRLRHPDGPGVTAVDRGVAIEGDERVTAGAMNDGDRQPLAGDYQHTHLIHHDDGTVSMTGPQLTFREFIAWMTDEAHQSRLRNAERYRGAREYARSYLAWLEAETGEEIDPTDAEAWPDPEPMPTNAERQAWIGQEVPIPVAIEPAPAAAHATAGEVQVIAETMSDTAVLVDPAPQMAASAGPAAVTTSTNIIAGVTASPAQVYTTAPTPTVDADIVETRTWVDDFSHFNTGGYYGSFSSSDPSNFEVTSAWGDESSQSLQTTLSGGSGGSMFSFDPSSDGGFYDQSGQSNGLPYYPQPGDTIYVRFRAPVGNDGSWNGAESSPRFYWNANGVSNRVHVQIALGLIDAPVELVEAVDSNTTTIDSGGATTNATISQGDVLQWEIEWSSNYYITADLYNLSANGQQLASLSGQGPSRSSYSIGFRDQNDQSPPARFDGVWVE